MPPFAPDPPAANSPPRRPISRVTSLKRDWTDSASTSTSTSASAAPAIKGELREIKVGQVTMYRTTQEVDDEDDDKEIEWATSPPERR